MTSAVETKSIEGLRGFARSVTGNTMLPGRSVQREIDQGEVIAGPISDQTLNQCSLDVSVLAGHHIPTASSKFLTIVAALLRMGELYGLADCGPCSKARPNKIRTAGSSA